MSNFKWFLLCIFSFFLIIIGLSSYDNSTYNACIDICYHESTYPSDSCKFKCYNYTSDFENEHNKEHDYDVYVYGSGSYAAGIVFMFFGSVIILCSIPAMSRRLKNRSPENTRNARTELMEVVGVGVDASAILREQLKAKNAQIQVLTER